MKVVFKNSSIKFESFDESYKVTNVVGYLNPNYKLTSTSGFNVNIVKVNKGDVISISGKMKLIAAAYAVYEGIPSNLTDASVLIDFTTNAPRLVEGDNSYDQTEKSINATFTVSKDNCVLMTSNTDNNSERTLKIVKNGIALN